MVTTDGQLEPVVSGFRHDLQGDGRIDPRDGHEPILGRAVATRLLPIRGRLEALDGQPAAPEPACGPAIPSSTARMTAWDRELIPSLR